MEQTFACLGKVVLPPEVPNLGMSTQYVLFTIRDLYLQIKVAEHDYFHRDKADIHVDVPLTVGDAILGANVRVPTLDGEVEVKVAPDRSWLGSSRHSTE